MLKDILDNSKDLQKHLFEKGFLITNADCLSLLPNYPFYDNWNTQHIGSYNIYIHKDAKIYTQQLQDGEELFLIGHAYNPFTMDYEETVILENLAISYGSDQFIEKINELTGIFIIGLIKDSYLEIIQDASGMQYVCYGTVDGYQYIASHMRLISDICNLPASDYVNRLIHYKWYKYMMGNYLPGEITCCEGIKRIIPNTKLVFDGTVFTVERFYPCKNIGVCNDEEEYEKVIEEAAQILKNTMALIPKKWCRPAISLTGGIDSNTTFAAANGHYDEYETFSYVSMFRESVDAEAARKISEHFAVPFKEYVIPESNEEVANFEIYKAIFEHNDGDIGRAKDDDTRKKIFLINSDVCDVEVKSWISETIRAYAYKYFGRTKFPKRLKPRNYTSLWKIFVLNRKLKIESDRYFAEYFDNTKVLDHIYDYDQSDLFVWEMMHGGKCGLNIGVMKSCFDITIPYNNRKLLDLLLRVPLKYRINDRHHMDLKRLMNQELYDMNIRVVNLNETKNRKIMANISYIINSHLPF